MQNVHIHWFFISMKLISSSFKLLTNTQFCFINLYSFFTVFLGSSERSYCISSDIFFLFRCTFRIFHPAMIFGDFYLTLLKYWKRFFSVTVYLLFPTCIPSRRFIPFFVLNRLHTEPSEEKREKLAQSFNFRFRYIDDVLSLSNSML